MAALRRTLARRLSQIGKTDVVPSVREDPAPLLSSFPQRRPLFQPAIPLDRLPLRVDGRFGGLRPDRICLDLLLPPPATGWSGSTPAMAEEATMEMDLKKAIRASQVEAARGRLRAVDASCIARSEFVRICCESSGEEKGAELAQLLDESGVVVVWDDIVFLRLEELSKAIESAIPPHLLHSRRLCGEEAEAREELARMAKAKEEIDRSAAAQVKRELWCGLAFLVVQTAAFARLTFWELSWDVMEPICFYVTSIYFMAGYAFFLRTSKEPSFEGFFEGRFAARQKRLILAREFNVQRFDELRKALGRRRDLSPPAAGNCRGHASSHCHCISESCKPCLRGRNM